MFVIKPYSITKTDITILKFHIPNELLIIKKYLWYVERNYMNRDNSEQYNYVPESWQFNIEWSRKDFEDQYVLWRDFLNEYYIEGKYPILDMKWKDSFMKRPHLQINDNDIIVYLIDSDIKEWSFPSYNLKLLLND